MSLYAGYTMKREEVRATNIVFFLNLTVVVVTETNFI